MDPKFPDITVQLTGADGNAFFIMGRVRKAMHRAHCSDDEIAEFLAECKSGDYDHLLQTVMRTVDVK